MVMTPQPEPSRLDRSEIEHLLLTGRIVATVRLRHSVGHAPVKVTFDNGLEGILKWSVVEDRPTAPEMVRNEVAAAELSNILGYDLVPPTVLRAAHEGQVVPEHSIQLLVSPSEENGDLRLVAERLVRQGATLDILMCQIDRHAHNWLIVDLGDEVAVVLIDNGCTFDFVPVAEVDWFEPGVPRSALIELAEEYGGPDLQRLDRLFQEGACARMVELLGEAKVASMLNRARALLDRREQIGDAPDVLPIEGDDGV